VGRFRRFRESPHAEAGIDHVTPIAKIERRQHTVIRGQVVRMRARPAAHLPILVVTVGDESGTATVAWTGRREIGGVTLGRQLEVRGTPMSRGDRFEFTNPAYTLLPPAGKH
jgi:hypothetical protein